MNFNLLNLYLISTCVDSSQMTFEQRAYTNVASEIILIDCYFTRFTQYGTSSSTHSTANDILNGWGGVIYCYNADLNFTAESSLFYNCSSIVGGGAIYFTCSGVHGLKLDKICASNCIAHNFGSNIEGNGNFAYLNAFTESLISYLSVTKCSPYYKKGGNSILLWVSKQITSNFNSSLNEGLGDSSILTLSTGSVSITQSSFVNNSGNSLVELNGGGGFTISNNNFVANIVYSKGVISYGAFPGVNIHDCIFTKNEGNLIYHQGGFLTFQNCYIDHQGITITMPDNNSPFTTKNLTFDVTSTFGITHYNTYLCHADVGLISYPERTFPPVPTPAQTMPAPPTPGRTYNENCGTSPTNPPIPSTPPNPLNEIVNAFNNLVQKILDRLNKQ